MANVIKIKRGAEVPTTNAQLAPGEIGFNTTDDSLYMNKGTDTTPDIVRVGEDADSILTKIKTVDGDSSGLDADLLDGKHASAFSLDGHTQAWSTITDKPTTATRWPAWSEVTSKPSTFTPSSHTHNYVPSSYLSEREMATSADDADDAGLTAYILRPTATNRPPGTDHSLLTLSFSNQWSTQLAGDWRTNEWYVRGQDAGVWGSWQKLWHSGNVPATATRWPAWSEVTSKPAQATRWPSWGEVSGKPGTFTPSSHSHNYLPSDYLSGRVLTNANSADGAGVTAYYLNAGASYSPPGNDHSLLTLSYSNIWSTQLASDWRTNEWYVRNQNNGSWGSWRNLWHSGNSYGSNSSSGYIRFQNGLKLNWVQVTIPASTRGKTFTWPSAFTSAVYTTWASSKYYDMQGAVDGVTTTGGAVNAGACSNQGTVGVAITWTAYGIGV